MEYNTFGCQGNILPEEMTSLEKPGSVEDTVLCYLMHITPI